LESAIEELADSIRKHGLLQPILVRRQAGRYVIVAGERRYRACKLLGRESIAARVLEVSSEESLGIAIAENVHRDSLLPLEEARAYECLMTTQSMRQADIARNLGIDRRRISEKLKLLMLPGAVQALLSGQPDNFSEAHALVLATAQDEDVVALARKCTHGGWSVQRLKNHLATKHAANGPRLFENIRVNMNRRGGFSMTVRARSRDEVEQAIGNVEAALASLRKSFLEVVRSTGQPLNEETEQTSE
jgi:ParB family chromosome partitioning protein